MAKEAPTKGKSAAPRGGGRPGFTLKPSKQTCIVLGSLVVLVLAGGAGLYFWQAGEIAQVEALVKQKREEVAQGEAIARKLTQMEEDYAGMQNQLRFLESSVSEKEYTPTLLKQMEGLANQVNLKVNSVRPSWEKAPPPPADKEKAKTYRPWPYDKFHADVEINGSYWNMARFLYRLTEFPKIMAVDALSISPKAASEYNPSLTAKLKLTGFVFRQDEAEKAREKEGTGGPNTNKDARPAQSASNGANRAPSSGGI